MYIVGYQKYPFARMLPRTCAATSTPSETSISMDGYHPIFSLGGTLAFTLMEMGLRIRLGYQDEKRSPGLYRLLAEAIKKELLVDQGFTAAQIDEGSEPVMSALAQSSGKPKQEYCAILLDSLPYLRNTFLHPAAYSDAGSSAAFAVLRGKRKEVGSLC